MIILCGGVFLMAIKMLMFDFRESEKNYFKENELENFDINFYRESLNKDTVSRLPREDLDNAMIISVFIESELDEKVINSFKNLRIISTRSTGVEHINQKAAEAKNIAVVNVEAYGSKSVAQYTFGLILALVRRIVPASKYIQDKQHSCTDFIGRDISKLTLGVIGTGSIGAAVCKIAKFFGMNVIAYDLKEKKEFTESFDIKYVDFETILKQSDIITLHLPYTGNNYHMFSDEQFNLMKNSAYLINTSRGEIVSTTSLYDAITKGKIKGAALDVLECEDMNFKCSRMSDITGGSLQCYLEAKALEELVKLPDVIVTPHIAYETQEAIDYILDVTFIAISDIIQGGNSYRVY